MMIVRPTAGHCIVIVLAVLIGRGQAVQMLRCHATESMSAVGSLFAKACAHRGDGEGTPLLDELNGLLVVDGNDLHASAASSSSSSGTNRGTDPLGKGNRAVGCDSGCHGARSVCHDHRGYPGQRKSSAGYVCSLLLLLLLLLWVCAPSLSASAPVLCSSFPRALDATSAARLHPTREQPWQDHLSEDAVRQETRRG
jgi:hypothetical protein